MTAALDDVPLPRDGSVLDLLLAAMRTRPQTIALVCGDERIDYASYGAAVLGLGRELRHLSADGGRIATLLPNSLDACIAHFAVLAAGRQLVPLNPDHVARELAFELHDSLPDVVLADPALREALAPTLAELPTMKVIWVGPGVRRLAEGFDKGVAADATIDPSSFAILQYTGGTSGKPKGVNLAHRALRINVAQREAALPTRDDGERIVCTMPLFHSYGMAMGLYLAARCRGTLVILPGYRREALLDAIEQHAITIFPGSPTIYAGLLDHPRFASTDWSSVHTCYSGAAALSVALLERWRAAVGVPIYEGYGQTEAGPVLSYNSPHAPIKVGSVGRSLAGTTIEIVDTRKRHDRPAAAHARRDPGARAAADVRLPQSRRGNRAGAARRLALHRRHRRARRRGPSLHPRSQEGHGHHRWLQRLSARGGRSAADASGGARGRRHRRARQLSRRSAARVRRPSQRGLGQGVAALQAHCEANLVRYKRPTRMTLVERLPKTSVNKTDKKALRGLVVAAPAG